MDRTHRYAAASLGPPARLAGAIPAGCGDGTATAPRGMAARQLAEASREGDGS